MLPRFLEAASRLRRERRELRVRVARPPDLPPDLYSRDGEGVRVAPSEEVLAGATAALTKSGTVTLQLALAGVPMVVAHRMHPVTHWLARRLVEVDHIALANLVAGREVVPELIQDEVTPARLARRVAPLLEAGGSRRRSMLSGLSEVRDRLGEPGCARRVAGHARELLSRHGAPAP